MKKKKKERKGKKNENEESAWKVSKINDTLPSLRIWYCTISGCWDQQLAPNEKRPVLRQWIFSIREYNSVQTLRRRSPIPVGPTPIKQIKFLPEIPTKKSLAPTTIVPRRFNIISPGPVYCIDHLKNRCTRRKKTNTRHNGKRILIEWWKQVENGTESWLLFVTFREYRVNILRERESLLQVQSTKGHLKGSLRCNLY